jgi:hypothetical protein
MLNRRATFGILAASLIVLTFSANLPATSSPSHPTFKTPELPANKFVEVQTAPPQVSAATPSVPRVNTTVVVVDQANQPFSMVKDFDCTMTITATLTNPVSASATVTYAAGSIVTMDRTTLLNGTVIFKITIGVGDPIGKYTVLVSVVKGPVTSPTRITFSEYHAQIPPPFPALHFDSP